MNNELVPTNILENLGVAKYADSKSFDIVAAGANFLPRLMLMGANSTAVKESKIGMGRFALVRSKDQVEDLTQEVAILVLSWRPKAMDLSDEDEIISVYNPESAEFKRISVKADSGESDTGCMYGPEFLVWVPSIQAFASYFMSSKTSRREAPKLRALMGKLALMKCQLIKKGKFAWHGPVVNICSQPVSNMPSMEEVSEQVTKFNNPPESESEQAPTEERAR